MESKVKVSINKVNKEPEEVAKTVVDAAIKVHRSLGPGLLESAYQRCLAYELTERGLLVECEVPIPVKYGDVSLEAGFRADMIIENCIIIENKTVDNVLPVHQAQMITYLKLSGIRIGFLINWNVPLLKHGLKRFISNTPDPDWRRVDSL